VSVDTYLKGKDTSSYLRLVHGDVAVLVSPTMVRWSRSVSLDTKGAWFWKVLDVEVAHEHGPACRH
jgi:hypothetical protein